MRDLSTRAIVIMMILIAVFASPQQCPAQTSAKFYLGADISALSSGRGGRGRAPSTAATTAPGARGRGPLVYQENGQPSSEFAIMMKHGWNAFRLRVFVSPTRAAPDNSLDNTIAVAKQIKAAGATFMLDIHYSDTWADPQHQETPVAWRNLDAAGLEKQVEDYSRDVISQLKAADAMPDMVQVGNEITGGFLWPTGHLHVPNSDVKSDTGQIHGAYPEPYDEAKVWETVTRLLKAGVRGVKTGAGGSPVQIILHIDCGGDWQVTQWWFDHITAAKVEYDIIGQSFYPNYHGTLAMLQQNMIECERRFHKPFMVVETGYPQSGGDAVMSSAETIAKPVLSATNARSKGYMQWSGTQQGQLQFMVDLVNTVQRAPAGAGVFYWAPEGAARNGMWNSDGSPAPSIDVLQNLTKLTERPPSRLPDPPGR